MHKIFIFLRLNIARNFQVVYNDNMKFFAKRSRLILALMPIMAIAFYTLTYNNSLNADNAYKPVEKVANIVAMMDKPDSGTPSDYGVLENIAIANKILYTADYFEGHSYGEVKASIATQKVYNIRKVKNGDVFMQSVSTSPFVKIADQKYVSGDTYLYRDGTNIRNDTAEFGEVKEMSQDGYLQKYGIVPREIAKYVINEQTVLSSAVESFPAKAGEGDYVFRLELDPDAATSYYANEVRTLSGATAKYPQFQSVTVTITIDGNWLVKSFTVSEIYVVDKPFKVTCEANLTETFSNINAGLDIPEAEPFLAYVPTGETEDQTAAVSPVQFLGTAFGSYLNGEPLYLDADIRIPAYKFSLDLKADIDLAAMRFDLLLDDEIYISYRRDKTATGVDGNGETVYSDNSRIYFKAGGIYGWMPVSAFSQSFPELLAMLPDISPGLSDKLSGLDIGSLLDDPASLLAGAQLTVGEEFSTVTLPVKIGSVTLDVEIEAYNEGGLRSLTAGAGLFNLAADINVVPLQSKPDMPQNTDSYPDLTFLADIIVPVARTFTGDYYDFNISGFAEAAGEKFDIDGTASYNRDEKSAKADVTVGAYGTAVDAKLAYVGETLYLSSGQLALSASVEDIKAAAEKFAGDLLSGITETGLPDLSAIAAKITGAEKGDGCVTLLLNGATIVIELDETVTAVSVTTSDINGFRFDGRIEIAIADAPRTVPVPQNAVALNDVMNIVGILTGTDFKGGASLSGNAAITYGGFSEAVCESLTFSAAFNGSGDFSADIYADNTGISGSVTAADDTLYVSAAGFNLKFALDGLSAPDLSGVLPPEIAYLADNGLKAPQSVQNIIALIGYIKSLSASGNNLTAEIDCGTLSLVADVTFGEEIRAAITLNAGELSLDVNVGAAFGAQSVEAPTGVFVPVEGVYDTLASVFKDKLLTFDVEAAVEAGTFSDTVTADGKLQGGQNGLTACASVGLSGAGLNARLTYADDILSAAAGNIAISASRTELADLISEFAGTYDVSSADLSAFAKKILGATIGQGFVTVKLTYGEVTLSFADGLLAYAQADLSGLTAGDAALALTASLSISAAETPLTVSKPDSTVPLSQLMSLCEDIKRLSGCDGFTLTGSAAIAFGSLADTLDYSVKFNKKAEFSLDYALRSAGLSGNVSKTADGFIRISAGDFRIKTPYEDSGSQTALPEFLTELLPAEIFSLAENGFDDINAAIADIAALKGLIKEFSADQSGIRISLATDRLFVNATVVTGQTLCAEAAVTTGFNGYNVSIGLSAAVSGSDGRISVPDGNYADVFDPVSVLLPAIAEAKTLAADFALNAVAPYGNGGEVDFSAEGNIKLSVYGGQPAFALDVNALGTPISVRLAGGNYYLQIGSLMLRLDGGDKQAFIDALYENLPAFIGDLFEKLLTFDVSGLTDGIKTGRTDSQTTFEGIDVTDDGKVVLQLETGGSLIKIKVAYPADGSVSGAELELHTADGAVLNVSLISPSVSPCYSLSDENGCLYAPVSPEDYVDVMLFSEYFAAIKATVASDGFELTLTEDLTVTLPGVTYLVNDGMTIGSDKAIYDEKGNPVTAPITRTVTICKNTAETPAVIRLVPEGVIGQNGWFINIFAQFTVKRTEEVIGVGQIIQSRELSQNISFTLVNEGGNKCVYLDYDGMKVKAGFNEVLGMLAYARDIIGISGTILDDIPESYYNAQLDTSIFGDMQLAGLDSLRTSVTEILKKAESIFNVLFGYPADPQSGLSGYDGALNALKSFTEARDIAELADIIGRLNTALGENGLSGESSSGDIMATVQSVIGTVGSLSLSFENGELSVAIPDEAGVSPAVISLSAANGKLASLSVGGLSFGETSVNGAVALNTDSVTVAPPEGGDATYDSVDSNGERLYYSDFSSVNNLFEDLINTADLKAFHIGGANNAEKGTITMTIPEVIGISSSIGINIPFTVKVQLVQDSEGTFKPLVYVRLEVPSFPLVVTESISSLYFYDGMFLFTRTTSETKYSTPDWNDTTYWTKTEYVKATTDTLLLKDANGQLDITNIMKYVYFMLPLSSTVQDPINEAIQNGITKDFSQSEQILNYYGYRNGNYRLGIDVSEISRIAELNDANITLNTKPAEGGGNYLDRLQADMTFLYGTTGIAKGIKLSVDGYLVNPGSSAGDITYYDPTRPNNSCPDKLSGWLINNHYHRDGVYTEDITVIPSMMAKIVGGGTISGAGTIDSPYSQYSCNSK